MIRKILQYCVCSLLLSKVVAAQELSIGLSGGMQGIQYKYNNQSSQLKPGGVLDIGYTIPLGEQLGIMTGISMGSYTSEITANGKQAYSSYQIDDAGSAFIYYVNIDGYKEKQQFLAAGIPVMLQYHTTGNTQWYINVGGKLLFPFNGKYTTTLGQVVTSGYYPDYKIEVKDVPALGFSTLNNWQGKRNFSLKPAATLSAATGISFKLNKNRLYVGAFLDYGLNNIADGNGDGSPVTYSSAGITGIQGNSVLKINNEVSAKLMGYGIQVRIGIPTGR